MGGTMNIAFYVDNLGQSEQNEQIFNAMNEAVENDLVSDASLFYNSVNFNPYSSKFGIFNSTDIWNYTGLLIATTINNAIFASKIPNKFKLVYLYKKDPNVLGLIEVRNTCQVLAADKDDYNEIYRLTGKKGVKLKEFKINKIIEAIKNDRNTKK